MAGAESLPGAAATGADAIQDDVTDAFDELAFAEYFGLLSMEDLVIVRPYNGDDDDRMLDELRPKYIVLFDPDPAFIRRIEVSAPS
jgi:DNA excision repair protein ERCC-4